MKTPKGYQNINLRYFERMINNHFYNEANMIEEILKSDLSKEEINKLVEYMLNHPYIEIVDLFRKRRYDREQLPRKVDSS